MSTTCIKSEKGWAIASKYGLYTDWAFTRKDAISRHCGDLDKTWAQCKKDGDYAVKIIITYQKGDAGENNRRKYKKN